MNVELTRKVVRDEVRTVRTVTSIGPVDGDPLGTFGWFIGVRCRNRDQSKERGRYGTCVICRRKLTDDEQIHMVFNVVRSGKRVGFRLCCAPCGQEHATHNRLKREGEA